MLIISKQGGMNMDNRAAIAYWSGNLQSGDGTIYLGAGLRLPFSFGSRFHEGQTGVNPERLMAGSLASCFSMALVSQLQDIGYKQTAVETRADVHLAKTGSGFEIRFLELLAKADLEEMSSEQYQQIAEQALQRCLISKLAAGTEIRLKTELREPQAV